LRSFDAMAARDLLEKVVAADREHSLGHSALGAAWSQLGYDEKARAACQRAFELSKGFRARKRATVSDAGS